MFGYREHVTDCRALDIKDDNIMVSFENYAVLADFASYFKHHTQHPRHIRAEDGRITYLSQNEFGDMRGRRLLPQISDFDQSIYAPPNTAGRFDPVQSHCYRAPEVFLGCAWSYPIDIWNLGLLVSYQPTCPGYRVVLELRGAESQS